LHLGRLTMDSLLLNNHFVGYKKVWLETWESIVRVRSWVDGWTREVQRGECDFLLAFLQA